uniref:dnaJ homolog subfamily C member 21-like n=1 Tax=Fragaria vesca subsp. vesca TaxID=101020 RepID=UPI0005CB2AF9|nr:PREDICTED: dnaJ homolog subfamily C member 21-like [Fragaria vesca subsp. vesca]
MVKNAKRLSYYEILGLNPNCSMDDVRHAYHELSKIYHPDKYNSSCGMSKDEASVKFLQIKYAYDILKEPDERAFYDSYLRTYAALEAFNPDLETVFVESINFNGYSDSGQGFYTVYSDVFDRIYANERAFQERYDLPWGSVHKPPCMGNLESSYPEVVQFYNYWLNFSSIMDFCWEDPHDQYDMSQVSRRRVKRWSRINMKARKKAKKEYNEKMRGLAQNAKRLIDRRAAREYEEPEWAKVVERRRKYGDPEVEEVKEKDDEWECVVCRKGFRSEKQCRNHEQSKKHRRIVSVLMELQSAHRNELDKEEVSQENEAKRDEVFGDLESHEELSDGAGDNKRENFSGAVGFDYDDDDEEEVDEMEALQAMVARRKTMEKVGEQVVEPMVDQYMAISSDVENDADEVAIKHDQLKNMNNSAGERKLKRRRRRAKNQNLI